MIRIKITEFIGMVKDKTGKKYNRTMLAQDIIDLAIEKNDNTMSTSSRTVKEHLYRMDNGKLNTTVYLPYLGRIGGIDARELISYPEL